MDIKEWLKRARALDREVKELREATMKSLSIAQGSGVDYSGERVQSSSDNGIESKFITYTDNAILLERKIEELEEYRKKVLTVIYSIDDTVLRTLLIARYINCKTWEQIAEDMGYSVKWVKTGLHSKALKQADKAKN